MHEGGNSRDTESASELSYHGRVIGKVPGKEFKFSQIHFLVETFNDIRFLTMK